MSGGARMLACRNDGAGTTSETGSSAARGAAGAASAAETARQALRHFAWSMPSPQQSSAGTDMPMLSHGASPDCAHTLATGPKASQKATNAAMRGRAFTARQSISPSHDCGK
jgi:hypothetical protein